MKRQRRRAEAARLEARYDGDAPMHQHRTSQFQGMQLETRARKIVEQLGGTWSRSRGMCCCPPTQPATPRQATHSESGPFLFIAFTAGLTERGMKSLAGQHGRGSWMGKGAKAVVTSGVRG